MSFPIISALGVLYVVFFIPYYDMKANTYQVNDMGSHRQLSYMPGAGFRPTTVSTGERHQEISAQCAEPTDYVEAPLWPYTDRLTDQLAGN